MKASRRQNDLPGFQWALLPFVFYVISFTGKAYLQKNKEYVWGKFRSDKMCWNKKKNEFEGGGCETSLRATCKLSWAAMPTWAKPAQCIHWSHLGFGVHRPYWTGCGQQYAVQSAPTEWHNCTCRLLPIITISTILESTGWKDIRRWWKCQTYEDNKTVQWKRKKKRAELLQLVFFTA